MRLANSASIAYAVTNLASQFEVGGPGQIAAGVLSRAPGDNAPNIVRSMAQTLDMELVDVRTPHVEYHPGALNAVAHDQVERAVATGRPVLIVLDEAHGAETGVVRALTAAIAERIEVQPCILIAISTSSGERQIVEYMADGLGVETGTISQYRTLDENLRLLNRITAAMK